MRVICSWCNRDLGVKEPLSNPEVSHGMCDTCRQRVAEEVAEYYRKSYFPEEEKSGNPNEER